MQKNRVLSCCKPLILECVYFFGVLLQNKVEINFDKVAGS